MLEAQLLGEGVVWVVVRLEHGGLRRRGAVRRIHGPRELGDRVVLVLGHLGRGLSVAPAEVDELGRVGDLLAGAAIFDEGRDVLFDVAVLERQAHLLARSVVADADSGGNVGVVPEAALGVVDAFLLEVLKFLRQSASALLDMWSTHIAGGLPVAVPAARRLLKDLDGSLVLGARRRQVDLRLLELGLVLALLVAHDHVRLGEEALDLQTVLLVAVARLVDRRRLLHLELQQLLDTIVHNLAALLHAASKGGQRLLELRLHLLRDALVGLAHGLDLGTHHIAR
jgi:hypothetical protein